MSEQHALPGYTTEVFMQATAQVGEMMKEVLPSTADLQQVLAVLPEIREKSERHKYELWWNGSEMLIVLDALQAAADEIKWQQQAWLEMLKARNHWHELYEEACTANTKVIESLQAEIDQLHAELTQMTSALQVYADDTNWSSDWSWKGINDPTLIAKRALAGGRSL